MTSGHRAFQQHAKRAEGSVDANGNIIKGAARLTGPIFTGSQTDVTFTDNQYHIVQNNVTIHGNLTIGGEGGLVLCAGATLTVNGALIHNGGRAFHIYGQTLTESGKDTGKLVINNSNAVAQRSALQVHLHPNHNLVSTAANWRYVRNCGIPFSAHLQ